MGLLIFFPLFLFVFVICGVAFIHHLPPDRANTLPEELQDKIRTRTKFQVVYFIIAMISWNMWFSGAALPIVSILIVIGCSAMFVRSSEIKAQLRQQYEEQNKE